MEGDSSVVYTRPGEKNGNAKPQPDEKPKDSKEQKRESVTDENEFMLFKKPKTKRLFGEANAVKESAPQLPVASKEVQCECD